MQLREHVKFVPLLKSGVDWDSRYRKGWAYGKEPNKFLVDAVSSKLHWPMSTGTLDICCLAEGQGRNAVYLVSLGCRVLAVDSSAVALAKCQLLAEQRLSSVESRGRLMVELCDLATCFPKTEGEFDVIVDIFSSLPPDVRNRTMSFVARKVKPGGYFIFEGFAPRHSQINPALGPAPECLVDGETLLRELGTEFEKVYLEELETQLSEGPFHNGRFWCFSCFFLKKIIITFFSRCVSTRLVAKRRCSGWMMEYRQSIDRIFGLKSKEWSDQSVARSCLDMEGRHEADRLLRCATKSVEIAVSSFPAGWCRSCWLPSCICHSITPVKEDELVFSILCHPQEFLRSTSSAKLAALALNAQFFVVGADQDRLECLLEEADPLFILFPNAPEGCKTISVPQMMELKPRHVLVPDGSWEACGAMVVDLVKHNSSKSFHFVALDEAKVEKEFSPLIEGRTRKKEKDVCLFTFFFCFAKP